MTKTRSPKATRLGRITEYLVEMFPPVSHLILGASIFCVNYFALQAIAGISPLVYSWRAVAGALSVVLFLLLMRVYDELKDVEADLAYGSSGDEKYVNRPIVAGRITVADLSILRWTVTGLLLVLNVPLGWPWPGLAFAFLFLFAWLSYKWFFWPAVSRHLLLAFATHNPISLALFGYIFAVFVGDFGDRAGPGLLLLPLALTTWLPVVAWEISRKVRLPEDETEYPTYSKVLGWRLATVIPIGLVTIAAASLLFVARAAAVGPVFPCILVLAALLAIGACVRHLIAPTARSARLQTPMEAYLLISKLGFTLALAIERGIELTPA